MPPTAMRSELATAVEWLNRAFTPEGGRSPSAFPLSFRYAGLPSAGALTAWPADSSEATHRRQELRLTEPGTGLECACEVTRYDEFPAVAWVVRFANRGDRTTAVLADILPLDALFPVDAATPCRVHHARGALTQTDDFEPLITPLTFRQGGSALALVAKVGKSSTLHLPFFNLQMGNRGVIGAIGWSGGWRASFERERDGIRVQAGMERTHLVLHPGEEIRTPRILLLFWEGDLTRAHNLWRQLILQHYSPRPNGELLRPPFCEGVWGARRAGSHVQKIDWLKENHIGSECYWIDAGWYGERPLAETADGLSAAWMLEAGNWEPNREGYPDGLAPVGRAAAEAGMGFLLWIEPERVHDGTRLHREHPEWLLGPTPCAGGGENYLVNLGIPEARRYITDLVSGLIEEGGVTCYRQDFNDLRAPEIFAKADAPDRVGMTEIGHITGLYAFWDELLARHPGLVIDNCAGGGQRIDLETMTRSVPLWRSDLQCFPFSPVAMQTQTQGLAPWVPLSAAVCEGPTAYAMRSALGPGMVTHWATHALEGGLELPVERIRALTSEALTVRKYFYGDFYPLLSFSLAADAWAAWQYDRPDLGEGMVVAFRRHAAPFPCCEAKLQGLDAGAEYDVYSWDGQASRRMPGSDLMTQGLLLAIEEAPGSLLFTYSRVS